MSTDNKALQVTSSPLRAPVAPEGTRYTAAKQNARRGFVTGAPNPPGNPRRTDESGTVSPIDAQR